MVQQFPSRVASETARTRHSVLTGYSRLVIVNELIALLYGFANTIKAFLKISRTFRVTSNSRLRRRSSSYLRCLVSEASKRFVSMGSQVLAPLMHGGVRNAQLSGSVRDWLAAWLRQSHRLALELGRLGFLHSLHPCSPSFCSSIPQRFPTLRIQGKLMGAVPPLHS